VSLCRDGNNFRCAFLVICVVSFLVRGQARFTAHESAGCAAVKRQRRGARLVIASVAGKPAAATRGRAMLDDDKRCICGRFLSPPRAVSAGAKRRRLG